MIISLWDYFSKNHFMPHGHCYLWKPSILWLHVVSDLVIALSYFSIPIMLFYFVSKKRNLPHPRIFKLFATFIFWCGITHLISIWTVWDPVYQIEGIAKGITAGVSLATALALFPIIPEILALRSPRELDKINKKLQLALVEKDRAENELRATNDKLEAKIEERTRELSSYIKKLNSVNNELESFAYQASHDLKSPLGTLITFFDELKQDSNSSPKFKKYAPNMERQLRQLNHLITDLLDLSRLGSEPVNKEWVSLQDIISDAKANLHHLIVDKKAKIYTDNSFDIFVNRTQITLVFQNLIENALKYSDENREPELMISALEEGGIVKIEFKDNGIGIQKEDYDEIFRPFHRLHSSDNYPGTGLGLSICQKVIENHDGEISVKSDPGQGTSFFVQFPKGSESS